MITHASLVTKQDLELANAAWDAAVERGADPMPPVLEALAPVQRARWAEEALAELLVRLNRNPQRTHLRALVRDIASGLVDEYRERRR